MIKLKDIVYSLIFLTGVSCSDYQFEDLPKPSKEFLEIYSDTLICVYHTFDGLSDTIIWFPYVTEFTQMRDFERGWYNSASFTVSYNVSKGSYHQLNQNKLTPEETFYYIHWKSSSNQIKSSILFFGLNTKFDNLHAIDSLYKDTGNVNYHTYKMNEPISAFSMKNSLVNKFSDYSGKTWRLASMNNQFIKQPYSTIQLLDSVEYFNHLDLSALRHFNKLEKNKIYEQDISWVLRSLDSNQFDNFHYQILISSFIKDCFKSSPKRFFFAIEQSGINQKRIDFIYLILEQIMSRNEPFEFELKNFELSQSYPSYHQLEVFERIIKIIRNNRENGI